MFGRTGDRAVENLRARTKPPILPMRMIAISEGQALHHRRVGLLKRRLAHAELAATINKSCYRFFLSRPSSIMAVPVAVPKR